MREANSLEARARQSRGTSAAAIYAMAAAALKERAAKGVLVDVGCGTGVLKKYAHETIGKYIGVDAVRYEGFPAEAEFHQTNLDAGRIPLPDGGADVVAAVETIEHLENPRAFMRELVRLAKPRGWVLVTTPNILSLLSLLTLAVKKRFGGFQDSEYPAHITPVLEIDLRRIAAECGLEEVDIRYSHEGRIVLTPRHYPRWLSRLFPRALSDCLLMIGRKPA